MATQAFQPRRVCEARWLGLVQYSEGLRIQQSAVERLSSREAPEQLLLLEHPHVLTLGRGADNSNILADQKQLQSNSVELHEAGRGGDVTYHGPGQLVGYPIVALGAARRDAHRFLRDLEEGLIATADSLGVPAGREPGLTGVWVGGAKLAAIGVRIGTGWVTSHGFALNCGSDLSGFATIVPCGIGDRAVTALSRCLGREVSPEDVAAIA